MRAKCRSRPCLTAFNSRAHVPCGSPTAGTHYLRTEADASTILGNMSCRVFRLKTRYAARVQPPERPMAQDFELTELYLTEYSE